MKSNKALVMAIATLLSTSLAAPMFAQAPPPPDQTPAGQAPTPPLPQQQAPPPEAAPSQTPPDEQGPPPPAYAPAQLDQMVSPIALYPDPLIAQVLAAATYPDQIPDAARWADQHHYLSGQALADAIQADQLPWDPSVQALLPFPSVLSMMASDMPWTTAVGNAFMGQQQDVMDAVQRERHEAYQYGYLRSNPQVVVTPGPYIAIAPVNPAFVVVPYYNPAVVFVAPRPGFVVGGAIRFGFGVSVGAAFRPWGWGVVGYNRIDWRAHAVFVNDAHWGRTWGNRAVYVHPYPAVHRFTPAQHVEHGPEGHAVHPETQRERQDAREGRPTHEEHHDDHHDDHHDGHN